MAVDRTGGRSFGGPNKYIQKAGEIARLGEHVASLGANAFLLADPFEKIWGSERLAFFRTRQENPCTQRGCYHKNCHGGCPAQSLFVTGSISGPDPRCMNSVGKSNHSLHLCGALVVAGRRRLNTVNG